MNAIKNLIEKLCDLVMHGRNGSDSKCSIGGDAGSGNKRATGKTTGNDTGSAGCE